jgi:hypothetical protein
MKNNILTRIIPFVLLIAIVSSCTDPIAPPCRISKFYWEDQWHDASYNSAGRLISLIADSSSVFFYYDASMRLEKAEIFNGDPTPKYRYEFIQGPSGIIELNEYHMSIFGEEHNRVLFHYSAPNRVDYSIRQEFGTDPTPGFEIRYDFTYVNNNVRFIEGSSSVIHTEYSASRYDKKKNPFRVLAFAVGNPAFFPVCRMANFPVSDYDISFMSLFSFNNPLRAQYAITGSGLDPQVQTFVNTYGGPIAKKIVWNDTSYGTTNSEDYEFEFDCGLRAAE